MIPIQKADARILLVDDFSTMRMVVKMELRRLGYVQVDEADEGLSALGMILDSALASRPYSVIICDWDMPGLTGIDLLAKLKAEPSVSGIPVVMLSGESSNAFQLRAFDAGAIEYLVKPISPDTLAKKIEQVIELSAKVA